MRDAIESPLGRGARCAALTRHTTLGRILGGVRRVRAKLSPVTFDLGLDIVRYCDVAVLVDFIIVPPSGHSAPGSAQCAARPTSASALAAASASIFSAWFFTANFSTTIVS